MTRNEKADAIRTPSPTLEHGWRYARGAGKAAPSRSCRRHHTLPRCVSTKHPPAPIVARLSGAELGLAFPVRDARHAARWGEVIRQNVAAHAFEGAAANVRVARNFGVTEWTPDEGLDAAPKRADEALREAKVAGRNEIPELLVPA